MQDHPVTPVSGADQSSSSHIPDHALIGKAVGIPISAATPVISVSPVMLSAPGRALDLQMRVSAPTPEVTYRSCFCRTDMGSQTILPR